MPANVSTAGARLVTPQTVLTSGSRISTVQTPVLGTTSARIVTTQPGAPIGRLTVTTPTVVSTNNMIGTRISALNLTSLVAVTNPAQQRSLQTQGAKVITQPTQGILYIKSFMVILLKICLRYNPPNVTTSTDKNNHSKCGVNNCKD